MATKAPNREFELIAACCRPLQNPHRSTAVQQATRSDLDWQHLLRLAQWHRVEPHVLDGLRTAGIELPREALPLAREAQHQLAAVAGGARLGIPDEDIVQGRERILRSARTARPCGPCQRPEFKQRRARSR